MALAGRLNAGGVGRADGEAHRDAKACVVGLASTLEPPYLVVARSPDLATCLTEGLQSRHPEGDLSVDWTAGSETRAEQPGG